MSDKAKLSRIQESNRVSSNNNRNLVNKMLKQGSHQEWEADKNIPAIHLDFKRLLFLNSKNKETKTKSSFLTEDNLQGYILINLQGIDYKNLKRKYLSQSLQSEKMGKRNIFLMKKQ